MLLTWWPPSKVVFTLVTEDKELLRVTKRYTKAIVANEIPDKVSRQ